ncbi:hypothetical protein TREES_T100000398 [Tupaia chinensis]|uniref:Uncharacterized protein n=1 Tax=Tupaia chinensis TaxID=246437 RepID=L9L068_TUPCH|nr:hypothetical protein TREES_T100000398 [Tupaia chinensis]
MRGSSVTRKRVLASSRDSRVASTPPLSRSAGPRVKRIKTAPSGVRSRPLGNSRGTGGRVKLFHPGHKLQDSPTLQNGLSRCAPAAQQGGGSDKQSGKERDPTSRRPRRHRSPTWARHLLRRGPQGEAEAQSAYGWGCVSRVSVRNAERPSRPERRPARPLKCDTDERARPPLSSESWESPVAELERSGSPGNVLPPLHPAPLGTTATRSRLRARTYSPYVFPLVPTDCQSESPCLASGRSRCAGDAQADHGRV